MLRTGLNFEDSYLTFREGANYILIILAIEKTVISLLWSTPAWNKIR